VVCAAPCVALGCAAGGSFADRPSRDRRRDLRAQGIPPSHPAQARAFAIELCGPDFVAQRTHTVWITGSSDMTSGGSGIGSG
jgi:hypothetical protein